MIKRQTARNRLIGHSSVITLRQDLEVLPYRTTRVRHVKYFHSHEKITAAENNRQTVILSAFTSVHIDPREGGALGPSASVMKESRLPTGTKKMTATCLCPALPSCAALAKKIYMWSHCGGKSRCQAAFLLVFSEANKIYRPLNALVATIWVSFGHVAGCCVESVRILRSARFLLPFLFGGRVGRGARTCHLLQAKTCHVCLPSNRPFLASLRWLWATSSDRGNLDGCRCQVWKYPESFPRNVKWLQVNIFLMIACVFDSQTRYFVL